MQVSTTLRCGKVYHTLHKPPAAIYNRIALRGDHVFFIMRSLYTIPSFRVPRGGCEWLLIIHSLTNESFCPDCCSLYDLPNASHCLVSAALALVCPDDKVYAKMIKKTLSWGQEESFKIYAGETVVFTSPVFESVAERVMEACFATSTNHVYRIEMKDSAGDSWSDGAWIEIKDINDAVVFKAVMIGGQVENSNFGLCSPILKSGVWKSSNAFPTIGTSTPSVTLRGPKSRWGRTLRKPLRPFTSARRLPV